MSDIFIHLIPAFIVVVALVESDAYESVLRCSKRRYERLERAAAKARCLRILKDVNGRAKND